jgi:hypothetical protein
MLEIIEQVYRSKLMSVYFEGKWTRKRKRLNRRWDQSQHMHVPRIEHVTRWTTTHTASLKLIISLLKKRKIGKIRKK